MSREETIVRRPPPIQAESEQKPCLIVLSGEDVGRVYSLEGMTFVIGRGDDADLVVRDDGVSRHHAKLIRFSTSSIALKDLGSTNGTYVNGAPVKRRALQDGDRIQVGEVTILKFSYHDSLEERFQQQLYESATRDVLTGVLNRRFFQDALLREMSSARREGSDLTLLLLDIDFFKRVNDTFGHAQGDRVLRELGRLLRGAVRTEDTASRIGGEEFAVLARGTSVQGALILAERLRSLTERSLHRDPDGVEPLTISIGLAEYRPTVHETPEAFLEAADQALYAAKEAGRNRVCAG